MARNALFRVCADLDPRTAATLRTRFRPAFPEQVFLRTVTWAHGVEQSFPFNPGMQDAFISGLHSGAVTDAFVLSLGGQTMRPDGKRLFLAFSAMNGVGPAACGELDGRIEPIEPIGLMLQLKLQPMWNYAAKRVPA